MVSKLLQVSLEMCGASIDHGVYLILRFMSATHLFSLKINTNLSQVVLSWERRAARTLHKPTSSGSILVVGGSNANIASTLLHYNAENHTLVNSDGSRGRVDSVPNASDVRAAITSCLHSSLIVVEDRFKRCPSSNGRKIGHGPGVRSKAHFGVRK